MNLNNILQLCRDNGIPTTGWNMTSMRDSPLQIYDRPGYKALIENDTGMITIFDRRYSAWLPIIDTGSNIMTNKLMQENDWKMVDSGHGYRIAEFLKGAA